VTPIGAAPRTSLTVAEASAAVLAELRPVELEEVPLEASLGRVLGRDVVSPVALPPWDNASMDGYAVRSCDVRGARTDAPVALPVSGTIAAGGVATSPLAPHTAIRIMTGAPIPTGADSVIRVEDTDRGDERVLIVDARDAGRNVRPRGEDLREGDVAVAAGSLVGPAQLGVLASVGAAKVAVHRKPRVAVLATGDELVDVDRFVEVIAGRRIVSSNSYTLRAAVAMTGADVVDLGICGDDRAALRARLEEAIESRCDLLLTSGGVSVGTFDFTREVMRELGAKMGFWRVKIRPGGPLGFGTLHGIPWLGLPGNPVSSMVTFELFARPAIRRLRGERLPFPRTLEVVTDEEVSIAAPLTHFLRVVLERDAAGGAPHARLTGPQGSGLLTSMARAEALLVVPLEQFGRGPVPVGTALRAVPLGESALLATELVL
jgi:molybdopterin molybdotransferase